MKIEKRLRLLASQNPNYAPLLAQWEFDKRLLSRALNTVSNNFPHYSLHDESHSSTIINQIEKVIAPNIDFLSATDCWLLLEACYWHDSGMIINYDEKKKLIADKDFIEYLRVLSENDIEFSGYAKSILSGIGKNDITKLFNDSQFLTYIVADYYRSKHAYRSEENINNPLKIGVNSPRTFLIPKRIISFLGKICSCHGKDSNSILELPHSNDGMDSEDYAHPRYIASLLRIGDLLDIDDGRFCHTLLKNIAKIPESSLSHKHKHESIKNLYIDSRVIFIEAECQDYESFAVQQAWFEYIQSEFDYQKRVWNDIVPDERYIALPTVNNISCKIIGYLTVNGDVPKITLDKERIYQYLTGSLLYQSEIPFLRELIQNSIDAIHYKVWGKYFYDRESIHWVGDKSECEEKEIFIDKLSEESILININSCDDDSKMSFSIRDTGIGMSLLDVEKLMRVGSKNIGIKSRIISNMPDWAKPSGFFGIGLQSVFSVANDIVIESKQDGEPCYIIEMMKKENKLPSIGIKTSKRKWFEGTKVSMSLDTKILVGLKVTRSGYGLALNGSSDEEYRDPLIDSKSSGFDVVNEAEESLIKYIQRVFKSSHLKIFINGTQVAINENKYPISDFELGVDVDLDIKFTNKKRVQLLYKNSIVKWRSTEGFVCGRINIFKGNAEDWLSVSRDSIRGGRQRALNELYQSIIKKHSQEIFERATNKNLASLYLSVETDLKNDDWKKLNINDVVLNDIMYNNAVAKFYIDLEGDYQDEDEAEADLEHHSRVVGIVGLFGKLIIKSGKFPILTGTRAGSRLEVTLQVDNYDNCKFDHYVNPEIIKSALDDDFALGNAKRSAVSCFSEKYRKIALIKSDLPRSVYCRSVFAFKYDNDVQTEYILLPRGIDEIYFDKEIDIIVSYFNKIGVKLPEDEIISTFRECWSELGILRER